MNTISVWVLVIFFGSASGGKTIVVDDIASKAECEKASAMILTNKPEFSSAGMDAAKSNFGYTIDRCVEVKKVKAGK